MTNVEVNPYVIRIDKFVNSLEKLSHIFLHLEEKESLLTEEDYLSICEDVSERACKHCGHRELCLGKEKEHTYDMIREVVRTTENYGAELNVEVKRRIQKKCASAPFFLRTILEISGKEKQNLAWEQRMAQSRAGCAVQLDAFAHMVQHATHELNASIFEDKHLEKKIKNKLEKRGIKLLSTVFLVSQYGRYEIHVTVKAMKGECITTKELAEMITQCVGRVMVTEKDERNVLGNEYSTIVCVEGPRYHTLQGVAKIGKGCEKISGDNFSMLELPGGKQGIILSDGMGSGEKAFRESMRVVEVLEELLEAGFPEDTALQMMNTALVIGREEVHFSTIDMSIFNLYTGKCEIAKAGASTTFVKRNGKVESIKSTSLPMGVVSKLEIDQTGLQLHDGDMIIMITDGVLDALPVNEQDFLMQMIIEGTDCNNPKEMAHHILEQVLECSGQIPMDDMTVLVAGLWSLEK